MFEMLLMAQVATSDYVCWADFGYGVVDMSYMCGRSSQSATAALPENYFLPSQITAEPEASTVPMAGDSCSDFATQGEAQYHYINRTAPASVDGDRDGIACEELELIPNRVDGSRAATYNSNRYAGVEIVLFDVARRNIDGEFYLKVNAPGVGIFTTRRFSDHADALEHMRVYYGYTQGLE